jgi:hypothetical protein
VGSISRAFGPLQEDNMSNLSTSSIPHSGFVRLSNGNVVTSSHLAFIHSNPGPKASLEQLIDLALYELFTEGSASLNLPSTSERRPS